MLTANTVELLSRESDVPLSERTLNMDCSSQESGGEGMGDIYLVSPHCGQILQRVGTRWIIFLTKLNSLNRLRRQSKIQTEATAVADLRFLVDAA